MLRECGITLSGRDPKKLLPPIPQKDLLDEMRLTLSLIRIEYAKVMGKPLSFFNTQFGQSFTVLTCCRILQTLYTGQVMSKKAGVLWAESNIEKEWVSLVKNTWEDRKGVRFGEKIGIMTPSDLSEKTLAFIDIAINHGENKL